MQNRKQPQSISTRLTSNLLGIMQSVKQGLSAIKQKPLSALTMLLYYQTIMVKAMQEDNQQGLVASYPFSGNTVDMSGNGNDAVIYGAQLTEDRFGNANQAYYFDGASYIKGKAKNFPTADRTISIWFKPDIFSLSSERDRGGMLFGYGGNGCGTSLLMGINNLDDQPGGYDVGSSCQLNSVLYQDNKMFNASSEWVQWAFTKQLNITKIYLNGQLVKTDESNSLSDTYVTDKEFSVGTGVNPISGIAPYSDAITYNFRGAIDDLRVYNRSLSDNEIQDLYATKKNEPAKSSSNLEKGVVIGAGVTAAIALMGFGLFKCCQRQNRMEDENLDLELQNLEIAYSYSPD